MKLLQRIERLEDNAGPNECVYADVRGMTPAEEAAAMAQAQRQAGKRGTVISIIDRPLKPNETPLCIVQPGLWDALG